MFSFLLSAGCSLCVVMGHLLFCRAIPHKEFRHRAFFYFALGFLCVYFILEATGRSFGSVGGAGPDPFCWTAALPKTGAAFFILCNGFYYYFFITAGDTSPSEEILAWIQESGGATFFDLLSRMNESQFISQRLQDLERRALIVSRNREYRLTARGAAVLKLLRIYQRIMGRRTGG